MIKLQRDYSIMTYVDTFLFLVNMLKRFWIH